MKEVLKKLQKIRVDLQKMNLKKSGENKFAKFHYYELSDILPSINSLCLEAGITTRFYVTPDIESKMAVLDITDCETGSAIQFLIPFVIPDIKGANLVQNLGGAITYLRRYLFITAFEITENDTFDATIGKESKKETKPADKKRYPVYGICSHCDGWLHMAKSGTRLYCENWKDKKEHSSPNYTNQTVLPDYITDKNEAISFYFEQQKPTSNDDIAF